MQFYKLEIISIPKAAYLFMYTIK